VLGELSRIGEAVPADNGVKADHVAVFLDHGGT
jgi:hypothetical protein